MVILMVMVMVEIIFLKYQENPITMVDYLLVTMLVVGPELVVMEKTEVMEYLQVLMVVLGTS